MIVAAFVLCGFSGIAVESAPEESVRHLGTATGKPFKAGGVFLNGKYLPPPYAVERRGTGVFVNGRSVVAEVVDWNDFLKTQAGVRTSVATQETSVATAKVEESSAKVPVKIDRVEEVDELAALFDDDKTEKSAERKQEAKARPVVVRRPVVHEPKTVVSLALNGDFVLNDASKALLKRVNAARNGIEKILKGGGFICFGDDYSRVTGDRRTFLLVLEALPEAQRDAANFADFKARLRAADLVFFNEPLSRDLFRNRRDFRALQVRRSRLQLNARWDKVVEDASKTVL